MKVINKPVEMEAVQWTGHNLGEVKNFVGLALVIDYIEAINLTDVQTVISGISIRTMEGLKEVSKGDYIIKDINGDFHLCKSDTFGKTYEIVE